VVPDVYMIVARWSGRTPADVRVTSSGSSASAALPFSSSSAIVSTGTLASAVPLITTTWVRLGRSASAILATWVASSAMSTLEPESLRMNAASRASVVG
jgi:hypothetical protein